MLKLNAGLCVRSLSVESECNRCEVICPTSAITIQKGKTLPAINFSQCVSCGGCGAVCPSEALTLDEFVPTDFFFNFIQENDSLISCRKNVPCIAALSVEHIISLAVLKKELVFDMGHCSECKIASKCQPQIEENFEEATYILEAMESDATISMEDVKFEYEEQKYSDRREFLNSLNLKAVAHAKKTFEDEVQKATDEIVEHNLQKNRYCTFKKENYS